MNAPKQPELLLKNTTAEIYQKRNNIKSYLLQMGGFKNIQEAKKAFGTNSINEVYEPLLENWNAFVDSENKIRKEKYRGEVKKYIESQNKKIVEKVKTETKQKIIKKKEQATKRKENRQPRKKTDKTFIMKNVNVWRGDAVNLVGFINFFKDYMGKNIIVDVVYDGDKMETHTHTIPTTNKEFNDWFKKDAQYIYFYPEDTCVYGRIPDALLYVYEANNINTINFKKYIQFFKDANNGKCVFNPIRLWAEDKLNYAILKKNKDSKCRYSKVLTGLDEMEQKYINGVDENNINEVCNTLQIDIVIEKPLCDLKFIECKSIKKALKKFRFLNTRLNHVEVVNNDSIKHSLNEYVSTDKPTSSTRKDLTELKKQLEDENTYHTFHRDNHGLSKINTLNGVYALKNDMSEIFSKFEIDNNLINCKIDDIDDKDLSKFVNQGTHYNATTDFKNVLDFNTSNVFHIDMTKAYANFYKCNFYDGFLGKITDFRLTDKIEGVGLYLIDNLKIVDAKFKTYNDKMNIYKSNNVYTSAELNFLKSLGSSFTIVGGCWGVIPLDFRFNEEMLNGKTEEGNSYYAIWCGKCDSHYLQSKTWINGDYNFACVIKENTSGQVETYKEDEICIKYDKKHNYHLGHITAFITAYQRLNVLEQLLKIDYDNIIRVCVDGIYTITEVNDCVNAFRHKNNIEDKTFTNVAGETYVSNLNYENEEVAFAGEKRKHNKRELHIGAGGNGKTHRNLTDKGFIKLLYVSPSWKLARNKQNEYKSNVSVWARLITEDVEMIGYIKRYNNVLLIDEVSMLSEHQKEKIFEIYDDMKVIFCGDLGYQLPTITGEEMTPAGFDEIIQNDTNYRTNDVQLLELLRVLRQMISYDLNCYEINKFVIDEFKRFNRIITKEELSQKYDVKDMILTGTNETKNVYTEMFKHIEKYYCKENNRVYCNGDIIIGEKPDCKSELRHAYTTHSIQGETAYNNLFIDASKMFDARMFYTALSRAKRLDQIYIIE
jgi:hypothetical protein